MVVNRQVGQGEIRVLQDESMDPLVLGAFFMHPEHGLSIAKEWVQVSGRLLYVFVQQLVEELSIVSAVRVFFVGCLILILV